MALKIAQTIPTLSVASGVTTSSSFSLTSGYLRIASTTGCNISIGTSPSATSSDFYVAPNVPEIIKERVARQKIVGITTGASTIVNFGQNNGNPFLVGDYVTISGSVGIDTAHKAVLATTENPFTGNTSITIDYDSSSVGVVTVTNAYVARSVKVSAAGTASGSLFITEVQIASQA